jgi:arabinogalactan oligomer/maltooligosaccharide transport system permease protein
MASQDQVPDGGVAVSELPPSHARSWSGIGWGFMVKLFLMMLVNALGLAIVFSAMNVEAWGVLISTVVLVIAANIIYFGRRTLPLKYVYPGLVFLLVFQVFVFLYTGVVSFTNYGSGHAGSMEQAVEAALVQDERPIEDSPEYPASVIRNGDGALGLAINQDGIVGVGTPEQPLEPVDGAQVTETGQPAAVPDWEVLGIADLGAIQEEVNALRVPVSDEADDGSFRTRDGRKALIYQSTMVWDETAQSLTNTETGTVYEANHETGNFVAEDGTQLLTGWSVNVGLDNYTKLFTDANLRGSLTSVTMWTFAFAILTVLTSFGLGLLLALIYNDRRVHGQKILRTLFILPYAFPAFLSAILWRGMFNPEFGIINQWFFFGADISWLASPWLAKGVILWVNLWLSFPYWFLICTGALQALPGETLEAARVDGAGRWRQFRSITLPLLMISTAPLMIASFAFNFNNFTIIYLVTGGGPREGGETAGATDILLSWTYRIALGAEPKLQGFASALSVVIFAIVALISAIGFKYTKTFEEVR